MLTLPIVPSWSKTKGIVVFSGGSAANNLVDVFKHVSEDQKCPLSYVIPISDNGGSSSELIRVFGGPGIGDLRSRLVRLIPDNGDDPERIAIKALFNHRLPKDSMEARLEWLDIVEGTSDLWRSISSPKRELIRSFLNSANLEAVKRARPSSMFNFSSASIGNLFLTGARLFSGSLESAIYLFSSICRVPAEVSVLPAINTNFTHHISAGLADGTVITGQNNISHPSIPTALNAGEAASSTMGGTADEAEEHDHIEDANLPGSLPTLRKGYITFSKSGEEDLPARIERIWYINPYGQEMRFNANKQVIEALESARTIIYSIGSLYTSIIPNLILRGIGDAVASPQIKHKILILNSTIDRETGPSSDPYTALDFVAAIARACVYSRSRVPPSSDSSIVVRPQEYKQYVTHVLHLHGPGTPQVDKEALKELGIETMRLYGRPVSVEGKDGGVLRYDEEALRQGLEATIGKRPSGVMSRRNTLER
ncbi:uncharacterized protein PV09_08404 [Verruconis gallopava]|uniref:Uncharacterized protein n=1 Tax=Verruconis gallopava TaxID=253628 RepID=A0A0D2A188_9PEZI|nr:uncharacterized protein PV09_08404 [Verruconis gallopava]KIW00060.1 hypothetical protein PV09_08404 [Verruconis gallopava]